VPGLTGRSTRTPRGGPSLRSGPLRRSPVNSNVSRHRSVLSKSQLSETLRAHADSLRLASAVRVLVGANKLARPFLEVAGEGAAFGPALSLLEDRAHAGHGARQLYLTVVRAAVTESLELTRDYCRRSNQTAALSAQAWFPVFRLLRNALNHNFEFDFRPGDRKLLPVTWRSITITAAHEGAELSQDILSPPIAIEWLSELDDFIEKELR
jgi:hypothetical protein